MRAFESLCFVQNKLRTKNKFASWIQKFIFVEYSFGKKGYKVYNLQTKMIFVSWDVSYSKDFQLQNDFLKIFCVCLLELASL